MAAFLRDAVSRTGSTSITLPNFLYIGPDKAGSTWLADALAAHPDVWVTPAKDTYFFSEDYERGLPWYARQFRGAGDARVVTEVCHDYLFSGDACLRIASDLPDVRLMVCLRRPGDRAFSAYLHARKHGLLNGSFEHAIREAGWLVDHGRYATHLGRYVETFGRERIYVGVFDDLVSDSQSFVDDLFAWLGLEPMTLEPDLLEPRLAASTARSTHLARFVKQGARRARGLGLARLVGSVKRSSGVQRVLYRSFVPSDRPRADESTLRLIDESLAEEIAAVDRLFDLDLCGRWGLG